MYYTDVVYESLKFDLLVDVYSTLSVAGTAS